LAVISFNQAIGALGHVITLLAEANNRLSDLAERKTRHTIILAAQRDWNPLLADMPPDWDFWAEVDRRVDAELVDEESPPKWWQAASLILWNAFARLMGDLVAVGIALAMVGV